MAKAKNPALKTLEDIEAFIKENCFSLIKDTYGINMQWGGGKYDADGNNFTLTLKGVKEGGLSPEAQRYNGHRRLYKFPELGTQFTHLRKTYEITGMKLRSTKIIVKLVETGGSYLMKAETVAAILGIENGIF